MNWTLPRDANGWTLTPVFSGAKQIFVSSSQGNDSNNGSQSTPVKTWAKAAKLAVSGKQNVFFLKAGDVWNEPISNIPNGLAVEKPTVITKYGSGNRPRFIVPLGEVALLFYHNSFVFVSHIRFVPDKRTPNAPDFDFSDKQTSAFRGVDSHNIWIEGCAFKYFFISGYEGDSTHRATNLVARRNVIDRFFATNGSNTEGLYISQVDGVVLDENLFNHNGWSEEVSLPDGANKANIFRHNIYIQYDTTDITFINNIVVKGGATGAQLRSGGVCENNLFLYNPVALTYGLVNGGDEPVAGGVTGSLKNNVFFGGGTIDGQQRGIALQVANFKPESNMQISGNVFSHDTQFAFSAFIISVGAATNPQKAVGFHNVSISNNIAYKWDNAFEVQKGITVGSTGEWSIGNVKLDSNYFPKMTNTEGLVNVNSAITTPNFVDPERSVETYMKSLGGSPTLDAFLDVATNMSISGWDARFTATAVNNYIKAGLVVGTPTPTPTPTPAPVVKTVSSVVWIYEDGTIGTADLSGKIITGLNVIFNDGTKKSI